METTYLSNLKGFNCLEHLWLGGWAGTEPSTPTFSLSQLAISSFRSQDSGKLLGSGFATRAGTLACFLHVPTLVVYFVSGSSVFGSAHIVSIRAENGGGFLSSPSVLRGVSRSRLRFRAVCCLKCHLHEKENRGSGYHF